MAKEDGNTKKSSEPQKYSSAVQADHSPDLSTLSVKETQDLVNRLQHELEAQHQALHTTQKHLQHLHTKYTDLYDSISTGCCTLDEAGHILEANRWARRQFSLEQEAFSTTYLTEYILPEDHEIFALHLKQVYATKTSHTCELRFQPSTGTTFSAQLESHLVPDDTGRLTQCRTLIHDLSDRKQVEYVLHQYDSELALLNRASQVFNSALDLDQLLMNVLEEVRRLLEVVACSIWLHDPDTDELVCRYAIGPYSATVRGWRLAPGQGIAGTVARTGNSLIVSDVLGDERHFKGVDQETGQVLRSILCVAMKVKQHVIGVLQVLDTEPNRFDETDRVLQELLATTAAIAIQNAQLNERLQQHAKTRSLLIYEINHRVTNTLDTITDLFSFAQRHAKLKKYPVYLEMMMDLFHRVKILATSYSLLAEFEWNPLPLSELSSRVIHASLNILGTSKQITVEVHQSPIQIPPQQVNTLALILRELVANTVEHGLADRESGRITVHIARMGETVHLEFRDDGPGYSEDVLRFDQHNVGLYLIQKIVHRDLQGEIALPRDGGAVTVIRFKLADDSPAA